jgi:hypothetical protein
LLKGYVPAYWKVAQAIFILKPGKSPNELKSHLPIGLLPTVTNVFEKRLLKRLLRMVENNGLIPNTIHQSSVRLQAEALHNTTDT